MITIDGFKFYDEPGSCGTCAFFSNGSTEMFPGSQKGHCILWNEMHGRTINPPARCKKMFKMAFKYPDGSELSIVRKGE